MISMRRTTALLYLLLTLEAAAQTGPFTDGELLVRAPDDEVNRWAIYRVDPVSGQVAKLFEDMVYNYSEGGWITYEPRRDAVLAYTTHEPLGLFSARLFLIESDGAFTDLGFVGEKLQAMAPTGDGRVYLRKGTALNMLTSTNQLLPIFDGNGAPVDISLDHLIYDPGTNCLIGVPMTGIQTSNPCYAFEHITVHRLPLSADGLSVAGPITCSSYDTKNSAAPIGLDHLPGGKILLTLADGDTTSDRQLLEVDPVTLSIGLWAESDFSDLDGGVWLPALGGAVVLDDKNNVLRLHAKGSSGEGTVLPTDYPLGNGFTGWSSANAMTDIDLHGPGCGGLAKSFGHGLAGAGGLVPQFRSAYCPEIGKTMSLVLSDGVGGGLGITVVGTAPDAAPVNGGTLFVKQPFALLYFTTLPGAVGQPGVGATVSSIVIPNLSILVGFPLWAQGVVFDPAAPQGYAFSRGLEVRIG